VLALTVWMASGLLGSPASDTDTQATDGSATGAKDTEAELMKVEVRRAKTEQRAREIVLQGQLEPARTLQVRAEISSTIDTLPISKGQRVSTGDILATLAINGRDKDLAEATAQVRAAVSEQKAATQLSRQGLQSQLQSERAQASLASARAQRARIQRDIDNTKIVAPFSGIVNAMPVEQGELVTTGTVLAHLVDDSSFKVTAQVAQQVVSELSVGQEVVVKLITGQRLTGTLSFVASVADPKTRSFMVEAEIENPGEKVAAGVSASLIIPVATLDTIFLTPSALSLGDSGQLGVKLVDENNTVRFTPVQLVSTTIEGAWVSGIPEGSSVITLGQAFVAIGEKVEPILKTEIVEPNDSDSTTANEG